MAGLGDAQPELSDQAEGTGCSGLASPWPFSWASFADPCSWEASQTLHQDPLCPGLVILGVQVPKSHQQCPFSVLSLVQPVLGAKGFQDRFSWVCFCPGPVRVMSE